MCLVSTQIDSNTQDLNEWLPGGSATHKTYEEFVEQFGTDDFVLVSWDGCTVEDPRLEKFESFINDPAKNDGLIRGASSGKSVVEQMGESGLSKRSAKNRLKNIYFGADKKTTCLMIQLSEQGNQNRRDVIRLLRHAADEVPDLSWAKVYVTGPCFFAVQIDRETNRSAMFAFPACIVGSLLTWFFVRRIRLVIPILFAAGLSGVNGLGVMVLCGAKMNGILVLMPAFVMILTMAGCIHFLNYFLDELRSNDWQTSVNRALRIAIKPCTLSTTTTCIALFSLCSSNIPAVQSFGFYTAISLLFGLLFILVVFRAWLLCFETKFLDRRIRNRKHNVGEWLSTCWKTNWLRRSLLAGCVILAVLFSAGLYRAESALSTEKMFLEESRILRSAKWFGRNIASPNSIEMLIEVDRQKIPKMTDQMDVVWSLQRPVMRRDDTVSTFSIINFYGPLPPKARMSNLVKRASTESRLNENLPQLKKSRFFSDLENHRIWRVRIGLDIDHIDQFEPTVDEIRQQVAEIAEGNRKIEKITFTGMNYLATHSQKQLFEELARSFGLAFLIITPVMVIVLRGVVAGAVSMIPNIAPALIVFGGMGLLSIPITVGAILTATVGLGIAVDDTLHFLCWYRDYGKQSKSSSDDQRMGIINRVVNKCIRPMSQTSIICGISLLCFIPVHFIPVRQFSITIALLLAMALICDLVLLPLILASPIGRLFR